MDDVYRDWLTENEVNAFIGKNAEYYKYKWISHPDTQYFKGWNFAAFFCFTEWACYRRMYREVILVYLSIIVVTSGVAFATSSSGIDIDFFTTTLAYGIKACAGAFANGFYRKKALRTLRKTHWMDEDARIEYLARKGGTSILGVVVAIISEILIYILPWLSAVIVLGLMQKN